MNPSDENALTWPKMADRERLEDYAHNDKLYRGDHYEAFRIKFGGDVEAGYKKLRYIVANFPGLMSRVLADMLFGESITITAEDKNTQEFINNLIKDNDLINQLYESALINSRRGYDVFKIRIGKRNPSDPYAKPEIIIEQIGADKYFPVFDSKNARNVVSQDIIATTFKQGSNVYLHKEIHTPGQIINEVYLYDPDKMAVKASIPPETFGYKPVEQTGVNTSLVFGIPNYRDGNYWGPSDYRDLYSLFFALNNRITKIDNILDKHSDPILAVPVGVLDEEGSVRREELGMFEVDNENPGFNKPEYITWNANLENAFTQIDKLVDFLFMFSEVAPATMGADKNGITESGRALKFKLLSTIRKRNRKISYYDEAIKNMLFTATELANKWGISAGGIKPGQAEIPKIKWGDGVINDQTEMVDMTTQRIDNGTMSRADGIAYLDDITQEQAIEKVKEIDDEAKSELPVVSNNMNGNQANPQPPTPPNNPGPNAGQGV